MSRSVHGIELTAAGKAFLDHARLALAQVDAAVEAAGRAALPGRKTFAIGFQTGHEINWLPRAMHVLRDELKNIQVTISSDYSPDLAEALVRGRLDVAFLRAEPTFDLCYEVVDLYGLKQAVQAALNREIAICAGLRGGAGRSPTNKSAQAFAPRCGENCPVAPPKGIARAPARSRVRSVRNRWDLFTERSRA
jgi:hypothetical protein